MTTLAVLNIVFAGLRLFTILAWISMLNTSESANNPVVKIMRESPGYMIWVKLWTPPGIVALASLLAAGIGLLLLKPWARLLSIVYAVWAIVTGLIGFVVNYFFLVRPIMEEAGLKQCAEAVASLIGGCVGLIYPIILLFYMTRPRVINAFRPAGSEPPPLPTA